MSRDPLTDEATRSLPATLNAEVSSALERAAVSRRALSGRCRRRPSRTRAPAAAAAARARAGLVLRNARDGDVTPERAARWSRVTGAEA